MSTTTPKRRTASEWDELARTEILPMLQGGAKMREVAERFNNGNTNAIRAALGRIGYDTRGQELTNRPLTSDKPSVLAGQVAKRRQKGDPWWKIAAAAGKSEVELKALLQEHGYGELAQGRVASNGGGAEPEPGE